MRIVKQYKAANIHQPFEVGDVIRFWDDGKESDGIYEMICRWHRSYCLVLLNGNAGTLSNSDSDLNRLIKEFALCYDQYEKINFHGVDEGRAND